MKICKLVVEEKKGTYFYNLYTYIQLLNHSKELYFHQVVLTFTNISCYEYMNQHGNYTCRHLRTSSELSAKNTKVSKQCMKRRLQLQSDKNSIWG